MLLDALRPVNCPVTSFPSHTRRSPVCSIVHIAMAKRPNGLNNCHRRRWEHALNGDAENPFMPEFLLPNWRERLATAQSMAAPGIIEATQRPERPGKTA